MVATIALTLLAIGSIIWPIIGGYRDGAFAALYAALRNLFGFLVAMTFYRPLALAVTHLSPNLESYPMPKYLECVCFCTLFAVVFGLCRALKMRLCTPKVPALAPVDRIAGPILGIFTGLIGAGMLMLSWSLMPFSKYVPGDNGRVVEERLFWDAGATALRLYSAIARAMPGTVGFTLTDEPLRKDYNGNGLCDEGDEWDDGLVNNGRWDKGAIREYRERDEFTSDDVARIQSAPMH